MSAQYTPGPWQAHKGVLSGSPEVWDVTSRHNWHGSCDATPQGWFVATIHEVTDADSAAANARLIAAAPELLEALAGLEQFFQRPSETSVDKFDRIALQFYREVGIMAPGKSVSMASGDDTSDEERRQRFDAWYAEKAEAARAAIAKATGEA